MAVDLLVLFGSVGRQAAYALFNGHLERQDLVNHWEGVNADHFMAARVEVAPAGHRRR